jgi:hypothetical protein
MIVNGTYELNREKVLDEAIFLALCGLTQLREGLEITGVVRLKMAKVKLDATIKKINEKIDSQLCIPADKEVQSPLSPQFDTDGDITDETYLAIVAWDKDFLNLIEFIKKCFNHTYGVIKITPDEITIITGGWSSNEIIVEALIKNLIFRSMFWKSSNRGGRFVFINPNYQDEKIDSSEADDIEAEEALQQSYNQKNKTLNHILFLISSLFINKKKRKLFTEKETSIIFTKTKALTEHPYDHSTALFDFEEYLENEAWQKVHNKKYLDFLEAIKSEF